MDHSRIELVTFCIVSLWFSALCYRSQLAFADIFTHVIGSSALGIEVAKLHQMWCIQIPAYRRNMLHQDFTPKWV